MVLLAGGARFEGLSAAAPATSSSAAEAPFSARARELLEDLPPIQRMGWPEESTDLGTPGRRAGIDEASARERFEQLTREKAEGRWFAALVAADGPEPNAIRGRFKSWGGLLDFLQERDVLVEAWAYGQRGAVDARRLPASELNQWQVERRPTFTTVIYRDPYAGCWITNRLEFSFGASRLTLAAIANHARHRELLKLGGEILSTRTAAGRLSARAQWERLQSEVVAGRFPILEMPDFPVDDRDLFLAFEYEPDEQGNFRRALRAHRESGVEKRLLAEMPVLVLRVPGRAGTSQAIGFRRRGISDDWEPISNPIPGQDMVEMRVIDNQQPDSRLWNVLGFGEPELLRQSSLAAFSLLTASVERQRKALAVKRADLALVAEPIIAGLNIGGGVAGLGFPAGEAVRLAYNTITLPLLSAVPTVKQLREMFAFMAARDRDVELRFKPEEFLTREDIRRLRSASRKLSAAEVKEYLDRISTSELDAMLRLGRRGMWNERATTFLNLLTSAFKVSGASEQEGWLRDVFNSVYFSTQGDVNLSSIFLVAIGQEEMTPRSGVSLESLANGEGPAKAWAQYFTVSVDFRAIVNTAARWTKPTLAAKELEKPFPYAPHLGDLAAYEFRAFGFPFLMFYKRGLTRADARAFEEDYAYGLLGPRVVEHFPTRADMDAEIRAGRMVPLGYVRVRDGKGGWKSTNLAVFAHRIPEGRYRGRTALIIYGLKAYYESSELVQRALERFRQYEEALHVGGFIEQEIGAEPGAAEDPRKLEPVIHVGATAAESGYRARLAALLELERVAQKQRWGLEISGGESATANRLRSFLAEQGIQLPPEGPGLEVDGFYSSFRYRRLRDGSFRTHQLVNIPPPAELARDLDRVADSTRIEEARQQVASGARAAIVFLNDAVPRPADSGFEMGPLRRNEAGEVEGAGVLSEPAEVEQFFDWLQQLPVTDQARLRFNHFAGTLLRIQPPGLDHETQVFVTIEFAPGRVERGRTQPLTGEREVVCFEKGLWRRSVTDRRILEIEYDSHDVEVASRTFVNRGDRRNPQLGELIEETRTTQAWRRDFNAPQVDPYAPVLSKLRINHVTGEIAHDTYGLFPLPCEVADEDSVTTRRFDPFGRFVSAEVRQNLAPAGSEEPIRRVIEPTPGPARFRLTAKASGSEPAGRDVAPREIEVERQDLRRGVSRLEVYDNASFGRRVRESHTDPFDGTRSFTSETVHEYDPSWHAGLIPKRTRTRSVPGRVPLAQVEVTGYDPITRRLLGVQTDYTGKVSTNVWGPRWDNPVEVTTALRRTVVDFSADGMRLTGATTGLQSGEEIARSEVAFDGGSRQYRQTRQVWHRPGIPRGRESVTLSAFGRLISIRAGDQLEVRPLYDDEGREAGRVTFGASREGGEFSVRLREESGYQWDHGRRRAQVRTWLEGRPHDFFETETDEEGRLVRDGARKHPGIEWHTSLQYAQDTERVTRAETWQNGRLRSVAEGLEERRDTGDQAAWLLPVRVTPAWGLVRTNLHRLGDPWGRCLQSVAENGEAAWPATFLDLSPIPRVVEIRDRQGRVKERREFEFDSENWRNLPLDRVVRHRVSPWGEAVEVDRTAYLRGTDLAVYVERPGFRTHFDLERPFEAPRFQQALGPDHGRKILVKGQPETNVVAVCEVRLADRPSTDDQPAERVIEIRSLDLTGAFGLPFERRTLDRSGALLQAVSGVVSLPRPAATGAESLLATVEEAPAQGRTDYEYGLGAFEPRVGDGAKEYAFRPLSDAERVGDLWIVNPPPWRDVATRARNIRFRDGASGTNTRPGVVVEEWTAPRRLARNAFVPSVTNAWTAWEVQHFSEVGESTHSATVVQDAAGEVVVRVDRKRTADGTGALRTGYTLGWPPASAWNASADTNRFTLELQGSDFVAWMLEGESDVMIRFRDAHGREALLGATDNDAAIALWPLDSQQVLWLPHEQSPQYAASLGAVPGLRTRHRVLAASTPDLRAAGLDVSRPVTCSLTNSGTAAGFVRVSGPLQFLNPERPTFGGAPRPQRFQVEQHHGGFEVITRARNDPTPWERRVGSYWNASVRSQGHPIASIIARPHAPYDPLVIVRDFAPPQGPRPLYAIAGDDGHFVQYYETRHDDLVRVFTAGGGFATPRLETHNPAILEDELLPGTVTFGHGHEVTLPWAAGGAGVARAIAALRNRWAASVFDLGAQRLADFLAGRKPGESLFAQLSRAHRPADVQAAHVRALPPLAAALLDGRDLPWGDKTLVPLPTAPPAGPDRGELAARLGRLSLNTGPKPEGAPRGPDATGLIRHRQGTGVDEFVETIAETRLVELALRVGAVSVARQILTFFREQTQGGRTAVHAGYEARTGASIVPDPRLARPVEAEQPASAQVALAEVAFIYGVACRDAAAMELGWNLVNGLLERYRYRPETREGGWPRGVAELPPRSPRERTGVMLWPSPARYRLLTNARVFRLLNQLEKLAELGTIQPPSRPALSAARAEAAAWLTNRILPELERHGVAPSGLFEIQDVSGGQTTSAPERWTAAEDWLECLLALDDLGIARESLRHSLDNLARVHGVTVDGVWGIDWSLALLRPDAASPALTARFARVARQLEHGPALQTAWAGLARMRRDQGWPAVVTHAAASDALPTGQGSWIFPRRQEAVAPGRPNDPWPEELSVPLELEPADWPSGIQPGAPIEGTLAPPRDLAAFLSIAAAFYAALIGVTMFWWGLNLLRRRRARRLHRPGTGCLVPDAVMQQAELRWAQRVLGATPAPGADRSRYAQGPVEQNFHMQLRAIHRLVLEYRRLANGWDEGDPLLVEDSRDEWLNGIDEFAAMVGVYSRWVVKAGRKDGRRTADPLEASEDSNHLWSRLVMYFSEFHLELLELLGRYKQERAAGTVLESETERQMDAVLQAAGARQRLEPFDARHHFNAPADPSAMDLLLIQQPHASLGRIVDAMQEKLGIPRDHATAFVRKVQDFKAREDLYPVHPYLVELAKVLPHFALMGLFALVWYNLEMGGLRIDVYLRETALALLRDPRSLLWGLPLAAGLALSTLARALTIYQYRYRVRSHAESQMLLDVTVTSFFSRTARPSESAIRESGWWHPLWYDRWGWGLRACGLLGLGITLFSLPTPTFAIFMFVKAFLAVLLLLEAAGIGLPLALSQVARWLEDRSRRRRDAGVSGFLNSLYLVPTRPASLFWLSIKYHLQPSVPTGGAVAVVQSMAFYVLFSAAFFGIGGYLYKQTLYFWFQDTYRLGHDLKLAVGASLFWCTVYLLRFGLFILFAGVASALVTFPLRTLGGIAAFSYLGLHVFDSPLASRLAASPTLINGLVVAGAVLMLLEPEILSLVRRLPPLSILTRRRDHRREGALEAYRRDPDRAFGVVYMSGDDLSFHKLTPDLLMSRLHILREQLGSRGLELLSRMHPARDDAEVEAGFRALYELERRHDVTLWHPYQLVLPHEAPRFEARLGLNLAVPDAEQRANLLAAWHRRRWLVTMMSTAGHSQDTAINLVDIALRLDVERLAGSAVFYLIQNKYDNANHNRPSQLAYDQGEPGQRNKLARLLMAVAPGCRAYSLNDWTPFGFKAGGLVGMDLVPEEALKLTNMLVLDRNATAHDLDALMEDLKLALADPGVVIVIPGRGTTNTLTPLGQASQCVEEGNRALLKGVMALGGAAGESLGTGWGNIQAVYYGRVQRALCDPATPLTPLTSRTGRGAGFGERTAGLIGFGPHAVGISEDIWGVTQAAHNAIGLGLPVRFCRSRTLWHKIRETWSHAEWFSAFPRWAGGYVQMMLDPIMQRINDAGPLSVFAKEIRANGGRFFLSAPVALLTILLMPLAIIWEVSPFVRILILLWNFGLMMNQVLTGLGLLACLEATGFHRVSALAGAAAAGAICSGMPGLRELTPGLVPCGLLVGGFVSGLGRWLYHRGRDIILFGPQLVIHALGQVVRQSLEFVLSGASANDARSVNVPFRALVGPREDRPFERYANFVNLRTVVWGVGLASFLMNLFALAHLDFLNVVLLLPTLLFSVSCLVGPFLMGPRPGPHPGALGVLARVGGWLLALGLYTVSAWLIAQRGWSQGAAALLLLACIAGVGRAGLKHASFRWRLRATERRLQGRLATAGLAREPAADTASKLIGAGGDPARSTAILGEARVPEEHHAPCLALTREQVAPLLKSLTDCRPGPGLRGHPATSELARAFVLALFTFAWFGVVPVPGLLAFQAPDDLQFSVPLTGLLCFLAGMLAAVFATLALGRGVEWWLVRGSGRLSLENRAQAAWRRFQDLTRAGGQLAAHQVSNTYGLFTELQTYVDQRSCAYAHRTLGSIERLLATGDAAPRRPGVPGGSIPSPRSP